MKDAWRLLRLFQPYWRWMAGGIVLATITQLASVGLMAVSGWFITAMALAGATASPLNYFTPAALIRATTILRSGGRYLERLVSHEATFRLLTALRVRFFEALEPLAPAGLQSDRSGDLISRIRADVDTLSAFYLRLAVPAAAAVLTTTVVVTVLATVSIPLAAATLVWLALAGVAVPLLMQRLSAPHGADLVVASAGLRAELVEHIQHLDELAVFGAVERHRGRITSLSNQQIAAQRALTRLDGAAAASVGLAANLASWTALALLVPAVSAGSLAPAGLPAWILAVLASFEAVAGLPVAMQEIGRVLPAARRLFAIADRPPPVAEPADPLPWPAARPDLEFRDVSFRYARDSAWALRHVSFRLPAGHRTAVTGPSGSGKSTLINLLVRFWEYPEGSILLAGRELRDYSLEDLRRHIAVVPQQAVLFTGTIRDNLLLAAPRAAAVDLENACRTAQIHDFIAAQPSGYDTFVGEGGLQLSGGQIRRIAVAQALLRDAPILLLDEPGEGLDPLTERAMLAALLKEAVGRTVLLVTHRGVGLEAMDEVLRVSQGAVAAAGGAALPGSGAPAVQAPPP